ncbi:MAG: helix-turn-helix domain-containing protein [Alphaproteobacteria bacterium]
MTPIYADKYRQIIEQLVAARKAFGLTQQDIADRLGRPQSFVSKYERCERRLDVVEYAHICRLVGVDPCTALRNR